MTALAPRIALAGPNRWFFDVWSRFYDLPWVQRAVYRAPHDAVLAELRRERCDRVLDVGCGTGLLAARLRRALRGTTVVGCDFSHGMLQHARRRDRAVGWVQGDAGRLPFRSGLFDAVVSTEAFHWFPDRRRALAELGRVLRPGGRLLVVLVNPRYALTGRLVHLASRAVGEPFYWPTADQMRRDMARVGFAVEGQRRVHRVPGGILFPPVMTIGRVRAPDRHAAGPHASER